MRRNGSKRTLVRRHFSFSIFRGSRGDERNEPRRLIFRDRLEESSFLLLPDFESSHKCTAADEPPPLRFLISPSSCSPQFFHGDRKQRGDGGGGRTKRERERDRREIRNNLTLQFYGPTSGRGGPWRRNQTTTRTVLVPFPAYYTRRNLLRMLEAERKQS